MIQATAFSLNTLCFAPDTPLLEVLEQQERAVNSGLPAGIALIVNEKGQIIGTITDGDIRRAMLKHPSFEVPAAKVMHADPIVFPETHTYRQILDELPVALERKGRKSKKFLSKIVLVDQEGRPIRILDYHQLWEQRVATHRHVVVIGMGYVGFTLAVVLADRGFKTTGVDVDPQRVNALMEGQPYIHERGLDELFHRELHKNLKASTELPDDGDVFIIAVGTPISVAHTGISPAPDLSALVAAAEAVGQHLRPGNLVVLRSTVPVGACRKVVLPALEQASGLTAGKDFHLSFAPERTAEGKAIKELRELPQIIGGLNEDSTEATAALFRDITPTIVRLDSLEQAELAKLLNNSFRDLIFSFANAAAQVADHYNIDIVDTIRAANQGYTRDPIPLPSPGVGGACLTKDPYIFADVCRDLGIHDTLFAFGRRINESMHGFVAEKVLAQLRSLGKAPAEATVLLCGLAFKGEPETDDIRNSSAIEIAALLRPHVKTLIGHDPVATPAAIESWGVEAVSLPEGFAEVDAVLFLNNHRSYEKTDLPGMLRLMGPSPIVFDGWRLFNPQDVIHAGRCVYLNLSYMGSSVENGASSHPPALGHTPRSLRHTPRPPKGGELTT